jgi:hypothetical protein
VANLTRAKPLIGQFFYNVNGYADLCVDVIVRAAQLLCGTPKRVTCNETALQATGITIESDFCTYIKLWHNSP